MYRKRLLEQGIAADALDAIDREADEEIDAATAEAKAGPVPSADVLETQVWSDGGSAWRN